MGVRLTPWGLGRRGGDEHRGGGRKARLEHGKSPCDLRVACTELGRVAIEAGERLRQANQMLRTPRTRQSPGALGGLFFPTLVAQGGEGLRVALARDHGADDALSGVPRDITERVRPLDIPRSQCLLHVEDVGSPRLEEWGAIASFRPQRHEVRLRTKRRRQPSLAVERLNPLTGQHITLPSWHALDRGGADQAALETAGFQGLAQRDPIDARGFHGNRVSVTSSWWKYSSIHIYGWW